MLPSHLIHQEILLGALEAFPHAVGDSQILLSGKVLSQHPLPHPQSQINKHWYLVRNDSTESGALKDSGSKGVGWGRQGNSKTAEVSLSCVDREHGQRQSLLQCGDLE